MQATHLVIGVGNKWRQDDGVGLVTARAIADLNLPGVTVTTNASECSGLLDLWDGHDRVYLIDAAVGPATGTIHRFDVREQNLRPDLFGRSSHNFGVVHAIELARTLQRLPERLIVYGVAGRRFDVGEGLSQEVAAAVPTLVHDIQRELTSAEAL